jgi:hypothetical protein
MSDEHAQILDFEPAGTTSVDETTLVEQHCSHGLRARAYQVSNVVARIRAQAG